MIAFPCLGRLKFRHVVPLSKVEHATLTVRVPETVNGRGIVTRWSTLSRIVGREKNVGPRLVVDNRVVEFVGYNVVRQAGRDGVIGVGCHHMGHVVFVRTVSSEFCVEKTDVKLNRVRVRRVFDFVIPACGCCVECKETASVFDKGKESVPLVVAQAASVR